MKIFLIKINYACLNGISDSDARRAMGRTGNRQS